MPHVVIIFSDGERIGFESAADEPILKAARKAGIPLASDCEMGDCQTCKAHLKSGAVDIDELAFVTLDEEEISQGAVLTCVSIARQDVEIELPYIRGHLIPTRSAPLTVSAVESKSPTTIRLCGALPRNTPFQFHAGQYVNIAIPGGDAVRSYSMASNPRTPEELEFHIRLLPDGQMSNLLRNGNIVGSRLTVTGPMGVFYLREGSGPILMVAGGTGLAPMVSMLRSLEKSSRRIVLCYGVSRADDLYYVDELTALGRSLPGFQLRVAVMEPRAEWAGYTGVVTDLITQDDIDQSTQIYLCGPPAMLTAARKAVREFGASESMIFAEEFTPAVQLS